MVVFENKQKSIYPQVGEDLLDFLFWQKEQAGDISLYPHCSVVYDQGAAHEFISH